MRKAKDAVRKGNAWQIDVHDGISMRPYKEKRFFIQNLICRQKPY